MRAIILIVVSLLAFAVWADQSFADPATQTAAPGNGSAAESAGAGDQRAPVTATLQALSGEARALAAQADSAEKQGFTLPVGLMPAVARALSANVNDTAKTLSDMGSALDRYREILNTLVANPGIAGSTAIDRINPARPVAGGLVTVRETYTPGTDLVPGAAILVAKHWMDPWRLQTDDARGDNYISLGVAAGARAEFARESVRRKGLYGGMYAEAKLPLFVLSSGRIPAGQAITITYSKLRLPGRATGQFPLPLFVRTGSDRPFLPVQQSTFAIGPAQLSHLGVYAPAIVKTGVTFQVDLKFTDKFGNPAGGSLPPLDVLVDGSVAARVPAGTNPSPAVNLTLNAAGKHTLEVSSAGGGLGGAATVQVEDDPAWTVKWVDLHVHTAMSDALQSDAEIHERLDGVLDDVVLIDDDNRLSSVDWRHRRTQALDGFEWSAGLLSGGHHLVLSSAPFTFKDSPRLEYPTLADLYLGIHGPDELIVALPEIPADPRYLNPNVTRLVEIKAGTGTFEWYGNEFARRGYRVGFVGSSTAHNHQAGPPATTGRTAVMVEPGETLFHALRARRTWVTSGPRIMVAATVNGGYPGQRVASAADRVIKGEVIGTAGIDRIDLIRNGKVVDSRDLAADPTSETVKVSFDSSSAPVNGRDDLPRNGREWIGFIRAEGAAIASVDGSALRNTTREAVEINPSDSSRVDFITWTRGQPSSFDIDLAKPTGSVTLDMSLKSGFEDRDEIPRDRKPAAIPSRKLAVPMQELTQGRVVRHYDVDGYADTITFELVKKNPPDVADFNFTDERPFGEGDYYYVRVTQADDNMAWTSPVWVGGFDPP